MKSLKNITFLFLLLSFVSSYLANNYLDLNGSSINETFDFIKLFNSTSIISFFVSLALILIYIICSIIYTLKKVKQ